MERKRTSGTMIILLISLLIPAFHVQSAKAIGTIYIRADGSIDPPTAPISTVDHITYTFTGNIYDSIVVERSNIVIDGNGYTLQGPGSGDGIILEYDFNQISNRTIRNINIHGFNRGIYASCIYEGCVFSRNNITSTTGIYVHSSPCVISENNINGGATGIVVEGSEGRAYINGNNITENENKAITVFNDSTATISGNNISANGWGIGIGGFASGTISRNLVANNSGDGIHCGHGDAYIYENTVTGNEGNGIYVGGDGRGNVIGNMILNNHGAAVMLYWAWDSQLSNNTIAGNGYGVWVQASYDIRIYHNNFIDNTDQVHNDDSVNIWDDGYPSGGNYWSDFEERYPDAQELDDSGIWDTPYVINADNQDNYPLMEPWTPPPQTIMVGVDFDPETLNLKSEGKWTTAYVQLPEGYDPADIDATTILLNETISPILDPEYEFVTNSSEYLVDNNGDGILERMVKFDRAIVSELLLAQGITNGYVTLTITGKVDGTPFEGEDTIRVFLGGGGSGRRK